MEYEELKTYRLIDKEGYFLSHGRNIEIYSKLFENGLVFERFSSSYEQTR